MATLSLAPAWSASAPARIWRDPTLRMLAGAILLFGTFGCSLGVHQSLIATRLFGLSDGEYAGVLALTVAVAVGSAVAIGIATDRRPLRRRMATVVVLGMVAGPLLVWTARAPWAFLVAHLLLIPPSGSFLGQAFAMVRLASRGQPESARPGILATIRALFALPFVIVLPAWSLVLRDDAALLAIYPVIALVAALLLLLIRARWPSDRLGPLVEAKSGLGIRASLAELGSGPVLARTALVGAAQTGAAVGGVILGLVFAKAGRPAGDVGLFFGAFVAIEVMGAMLLAPLLRVVPRLALIALGVAIYAGYLMALPFLAGGPWVWALVLPAGLGGALVYTLAIAYLQDLLAARPGAGAALVSVQRVSTEGLSTAIYASGTALQGYATVAIAGGLVATLAAVTLLRLDGRRR